MFQVQPPRTGSLYTTDGVRLDADLYYPDAPGDFPVLLMRQPYGRAIASTVVYAHPRWYAAHGYIVVIQDVRGRGSSEGEFHLFQHEIEDGTETIHWAASLPQSTGEVGMYGFSYQGMTQLYAALNRPAPLKTLCPAMLAADLYYDWAYEGGAFCLSANLGWALQLAAETARLQSDKPAFTDLANAARSLPLNGAIPARPDILQHLAHYDPYYLTWLDHPDPQDPYWQTLSLTGQLHCLADLPMLHIGGWFDPYLRGTLNLYQTLQSHQAAPQHLIIGPWAHLPWGRKVGAMDYGAEAVSPCDRAQIRWFDHILKGQDTGLMDEPPLQWFEMGSNQWCWFPALPEPEPTAFYLSSTGLANLDDRDGQLHPQPCPAVNPIPDTIVHDPWRPVPSLGGHPAYPSGAWERSALDGRSDVLTYTSAPFAENLHLAGALCLELDCTADAVSFDLCAILSEVRPDGSVYNVSQGYLTVTTAQPTIRSVTLQPTCICLRAASALRLSISAACFPAYAVNPGTGVPLGQAAAIDHQIITLTIRPNFSQIWLPIVTKNTVTAINNPVT